MKMSMGIGQQMKLGLTQKMAPRMIQSMEILQLPLMALQERIDQELADNPLLEMRERDVDAPEETPEREDSDKPDVEQKELVVDEEHNNADDFERLLNLDADVPDHFDEKPRASSSRVQELGDRQHDMMANIVDRPESLHDHLLAQIGELDMPPELEMMCERIISSLSSEDGGYLKTSLADLLPANSPEGSLELAETALGIIQQLDPPGIAARDLKECLLLQLTPDNLFYEELRTLITHHLEDLRDNRLPQIEKATGYTIETIQDVWEELRKLNPKPAIEYLDRHVPTVTPDVFIDRQDDGTYKVRMEEARMPRLYISAYYRRRLQSPDCTPSEREYIKRKVTSAQWLIESIEQRRNTLTNVAQAVVDHQQKFLDEGPEYIEPLKMQQIADKVGVHVTTVSRAVDDKWVQTPRGILPLRKFFVGGTQTADGDDVAWDSIRIKLQEIVDHEDKANPHSDEKLMQLLAEEGLTVARRTITKYRKKMGIASSRQRRDWSKKKA